VEINADYVEGSRLRFADAVPRRAPSSGSAAG
jgi:hypothetical protein